MKITKFTYDPELFNKVSGIMTLPDRNINNEIKNKITNRWKTKLID